MKSNFPHFLLALTAYFIFGKFGLTLAIPPGFASAVWPASGVALACLILLKSYPAVIGIVCGSFLVNLSINSGSYSELDLIAFYIAAGIAIGASLQAFIGYKLYIKLLNPHSIIDTPQDIIRFMAIIGPVGSCISPTIGISTLYLLGIIPIENLGLSWLTWWVGDTIGILLFTPMLLSVFSQRNSLSNTRKLQVILPATMMFLGAIALFYTSTTTHSQTIKDGLNKNALQFYNALDYKLSISQNKLLAYKALYRSSKNVSREEFISFSKLLLHDDSLFRGVSWTEKVEHKDRSRLESELRQQGLSNFSFTEFNSKGNIVEANQRETYYPVLFIFPVAGNERVLGLDNGASSVRYEAMLQAEVAAQPIATAPVKLAQGDGENLAFIIFQPVFYPTEFDLETINIKDISTKDPLLIRGFVSGVFQINDLIGKLAKEADKLDYSMTINDVTDINQTVPILVSEHEPTESFPAVNKKLMFAGRALEMSFFPTAQLEVNNKDWISWIILTTGFLLAALLQGLVLLITANTENIRLEVNRKTQALQKAKKSAEQASQAKTDFTANVSHEIRTPLNAIVGLISLSLKTPLNPLQKDYLTKAKQACSTLLALLNHTLDFTKIEAGKLEVDESEFDIMDLLGKTYAVFSTQAMLQKLTFELHFPKSCPRLLIGDALRIEQILLNLCSNAFKFTHQGGVQLVVQAEVIAPSELELKLIVIDTGIGVSVEHQKHLFESFRQADSATNRKYGGTGLGLTISKQLVELMGGTIELQSKENIGSEFQITLPLKVAETNEIVSEAVFNQLYVRKPEKLVSTEPSMDELLASQKNEIIETKLPNYSSENIENKQNVQLTVESSASLKLANLSILLVEDVEINQLIAQTILEEHGANVCIANNGREALDVLAERQAFDLILMDIQMPEMDGIEATKLIQQNDLIKHIPVLALTANVMTSDLKLYLSIGMRGLVAKPFEEEELLSKVIQNTCE